MNDTETIGLEPRIGSGILISAFRHGRYQFRTVLEEGLIETYAREEKPEQPEYPWTPWIAVHTLSMNGLGKLIQEHGGSPEAEAIEMAMAVHEAAQSDPEAG